MATEMMISIVNPESPDGSDKQYEIKYLEYTLSTVVTIKPSSVDKWISDIEGTYHDRLDSLVVGLDIEWLHNDSKKVEHRAATLQLCVESSCLIFQIIHATEIPMSLKNFLNNPQYTFVGVGIEYDVEKLFRDYELVVGRKSELKTLAVEETGVKTVLNKGLTELAAMVLEKDKETMKLESATMSPWDEKQLTLEQVQYASVDAFLSFVTGKILLFGKQS
ncbi:unnamed protein product [Lactuca saligna]|uniref:3'-5' exonuclease domain-containing protein n=1 Tax=Lactuca saligna TaxID=75948 RepID=A0AA35Y5D0_LACSI|nr:unnamed protein product [Lactuca saligna]